MKPITKSLYITFIVLFFACQTKPEVTEETEEEDAAATAQADVTGQAGSAFQKTDPNDSLVLLKLYKVANGKNWNHPWALQASVREWFGVELNEAGRVVGLKLVNENVTGELTEELIKLSKLSNINFDANTVKGNILGFEDNFGSELIRKYSYNMEKWSPTAPPYNPKRWFAYTDHPIQLFSSAAEDSVLAEVTSRFFIVLEEMSNPEGTISKGGVTGKMVRVSPEEGPSKGTEGYLFSGFLTRLPPLSSQDPKSAAPYLPLLWTSSSNCCFKKGDGDALIPYEGEVSGMGTTYALEAGVTITYGYGYESGSFYVDLQPARYSFQEAFLLAKNMYKDKFEELGIIELPTKATRFQPNEYTTVTVEFKENRINSLSIEQGEGCFEQWFIRRKEDGTLQVGSEGGC